ncbi:hypothetical protein Tco_1010910 [Tanacetum coccineum]
MVVGYCFRFALSASFVFFSPSAGEALPWPTEGTPLSIAFDDVFSIIVANLFKRFGLVDQETLMEVPIKGSSVQQPESSLTSSDNSVIFEGSSFSSVGMHLETLCEAKSLDSSGFREVTRTCPSKTEVIEPEPSTLEVELIKEMEDVKLKCLRVYRER